LIAGETGQGFPVFGPSAYPPRFLKRQIFGENKKKPESRFASEKRAR